jgi:hypothetical protein
LRDAVAGAGLGTDGESGEHNAGCGGKDGEQFRFHILVFWFGLKRVVFIGFTSSNPADAPIPQEFFFRGCRRFSGQSIKDSRSMTSESLTGGRPVIA